MKVRTTVVCPAMLCPSNGDVLATPLSEKDIEHKQDGDSGMESMFGRMNGLLVKTEWKKLLKSSAFSVSLHSCT